MEQHNVIANHKGSAVKDADCAGMVAIMMELKYFDQQFVYYGTTYVENNIIKYRIHDKAEKMYRFFENSMQKHLYPLEVVRYVQYRKVPSGKETEIAAEVQKSLAQYLKDCYPKELYYLLQRVGAIHATNDAQTMLQLWQDQLELCFEGDQINLFAGAVKLAFQSKLIDNQTYLAYLEWIEDKLTQIVSHTNVRWRKSCSMHGFIYWEYGKQQVYTNALWQKAMERQHEVRANQLRCTPIFSKTYWMDSVPTWDLTKWRSKFEEDIAALMDENYLNRLQQIWSLPAVVDAALFQRLSQNVNVEQYPAAKKVIQYYGLLWNCI